MRCASLFCSLSSLLVLAACGGDPIRAELDASTPSDAAPLDAYVALDAPAPIDAAPRLDARDDAALPGDAGPPAFGTIVGTCGTVAAELDEADPSFVLVRFDFADDAFDDPEERPLLTAGAQEILAEGTAGGSSGISEAFAFEVLARCEGASLVKTETEIAYDPPTSKKTDILVAIDGMQVGVSVTRAVTFPPTEPYTTERAMFIEGKLDDILESSANVVAEDSWVKQLLVVMAYGDMHAESIRTVWEGLDAETRADTVLYVVVTDGADDIVYFE
ncbi:MAG: hypothetical protein M3Y87_04730 [Myxococcota bacterium]|nr:hypothetical protein [Myxococcota bacterium]